LTYGTAEKGEVGYLKQEWQEGVWNQREGVGEDKGRTCGMKVVRSFKLLVSHCSAGK